MFKSAALSLAGREDPTGQHLRYIFLGVILLHCFIKHHSAIHTASHTLSIQQAAMAPKAEKKPAKKVAKTAKTGSKKKSRVKVESFKIYIYKVLKQASTPGPCCPLPVAY